MVKIMLKNWGLGGILLGFLLYTNIVGAAISQFNINLAWGVKNPSEITKLQVFLTEQGVYSGPITGNFLSQTYQAVRKFQTIQNVSPITGYFGPLTRAKANQIIAMSTGSPTVSNSINTTNTNTTVAKSKPTIPVAVIPKATATLIKATSSPIASTGLEWGAYVGDGSSDLSNFESLVGKKMKLYADFEGWGNEFPYWLSSKVGEQGKTLVIFWEPDFGYDQINNGSKDSYIKEFAVEAKAYNYPVILVPFDEMNLNEEAWGYGVNGNTATKFITAWKRIHDVFVNVGASNVKFALAYNNVSIPNVSGNQYKDYYPGSEYVDYVGVDGFNFGSPWQSFAQIFDSAISSASTFGKPLYIFSTGSVPGSGKAEWISTGLGSHIQNYKNLKGWLWFNQNGGDGNWIVNSDANALTSFKAIIP